MHMIDFGPVQSTICYNFKNSGRKMKQRGASLLIATCVEFKLFMTQGMCGAILVGSTGNLGGLQNESQDISFPSSFPTFSMYGYANNTKKT